MAEPDVEAFIRELLRGPAGERRGHAPEVGPSIPRVYATTLFDGPPSHLALEIMALPLRPDFAVDAVFRPDDSSRAQRAADVLGMEVTEDVDPESLPLVLAQTLGGSIGRGFENDPVNRFAARAVLEPVVVVERSVARGQSIIDLASGGTASAAFAIAHGEPLLLLATPVAIVVMGAARGVARALERGLYERIYDWITGTPPPEPAVPAIRPEEPTVPEERDEPPESAGPPEPAT